MILLIDDDEVTNYINKRVITTLHPDAEVVITTNGKEALQTIDERINRNEPCFDIVLVDISMPHMDGWEFTEALSSDRYSPYRGKTVCMLTSSVFEDDVQRALSYPMIKGFYSKPLDAPKAAEIISR